MIRIEEFVWIGSVATQKCMTSGNSRSLHENKVACLKHFLQALANPSVYKENMIKLVVSDERFQGNIKARVTTDTEINPEY